ncbi:MAG TPA: serine hydrolase domain-containing protein [Vicinamibacterales bacterium]|nr:serine hydrolase domain-containing protein [Vicinamibacterales bacterium]
MRRALAALVAVLLLLPGPARGNDLLLGLFERYLDALRRQAGIPGLAAAIVGETGILWERGFGFQDIEQAVAAQPDTPWHLDGLTQIVTATLVLRCVEEGRLSLDDRVASVDPRSPEAGATVRQLLAHAPADGPAAFQYRPERLVALAPVVEACTGRPFAAAVGALLDRLAMMDSVPGHDAVDAPDLFERPAIERYAAVLRRLAVPYAVDARNRASRSVYVATRLGPAGGLVSTARDLARFDLALRQGVLLRPETLAIAWRGLADDTGRPLPHGLGWFVQVRNGEPIVWQFGVAANASSSLVITAPRRQVTLILLANSDGLVAPFPLAAGDLSASPFGRLFLGLFAA